MVVPRIRARRTGRRVEENAVTLVLMFVCLLFGLKKRFALGSKRWLKGGFFFFVGKSVCEGGQGGARWVDFEL